MPLFVFTNFVYRLQLLQLWRKKNKQNGGSVSINLINHFNKLIFPKKFYTISVNIPGYIWRPHFPQICQIIFIIKKEVADHSQNEER